MTGLSSMAFTVTFNDLATAGQPAGSEQGR